LTTVPDARLRPQKEVVKATYISFSGAGKSGLYMYMYILPLCIMVVDKVVEYKQPNSLLLHPLAGPLHHKVGSKR
jgi:hypothetical protein